MPPKLTHKSLVTINIDDGEYRRIGTLARLHRHVRIDVPLEVLLTTDPSHSFIEKLDNLQAFLRTRRASRSDRTPLVLNRDKDDRTDDSNSNDDLDNTSWLGFTIKVPAGEWGHGTNVGGHLGFKTEDIPKHTGLTSSQWSNYLVRTITPSVNLFY